MEPATFSLFILGSLVVFAVHIVCVGTDCSPPCPNGEYCDLGECSTCQPCGSELDSRGLPINWNSKCHTDYKVHGAGGCPNFCRAPFSSTPPTPNLSLCESELVCRSYETILDGNRSTSRVHSWRKPVYKPQADSEGKTIRQVGSNCTQDDEFPIGTTQIHFEVVNTHGTLLANCTMNITVLDAQPPHMRCPADITAYTSADSKPRNITWPEPVVFDNSGNWTLHLLSPLEDYVPSQPGITSVEYEAVDPSGNSNNCSFTINLKDVSIECLSNQTKPVIKGGDKGLNYKCNHPIEYNLPPGETSLECHLYGMDGKVITSCRSTIVKPGTSSLSTQQPTTSLATTESPPGEQRGIKVVPVVMSVIGIFAVIILLILLCVYRCRQNQQSQLPPKHPAGLPFTDAEERLGLVDKGSPSTSSTDDNTLYKNENEMSPAKQGGDNDSNDSIRNRPDGPDGSSSILSSHISNPSTQNGVLPSSNQSTPNGIGPDGYNSSLQNSQDNHDPQIEAVFSRNSNRTGAQCNQTIKDLLNDPNTVKKLCVLLDPSEQLLKSVSSAYGIEFEKQRYMRHYSDPVKYPMFEQILEHISDTDTHLGEDKQKIFTLLQTLYFNRDSHPDALIVKAIRTVLDNVHHDCPVCC